MRPAAGIRRRSSSMMTLDQNVLESESNSKESIPWAEQLQTDLDSVACRKRRSTDASASDIRIASRLKSDGRSISTLSPSTDATLSRLSKISPPRCDSVISNLSIAAESQQTDALPPLPPMLTSTASQKQSSLPTTIGGAKPRPISPAMQFHSLRSQPLSHSRPQPQKRNSRPLSRQSIQGKENPGPFSELFRQSSISLSFSVRDSQYKEHNNSWFLGNDYNEDEATFNENNQLTGATLAAYIELLTPHRTGAGNYFLSMVNNGADMFHLLTKVSIFHSLIVRSDTHLNFLHYLPPVQHSKRSRFSIDSKIQPAATSWIGCASEQAVGPKETRSSPSEVGAFFFSVSNRCRFWSVCLPNHDR